MGVMVRAGVQVGTMGYLTAPYSPPLRQPGPAKCAPTPERQSGNDDAASWFRGWCASHRMSIRDLAAVLGVSLAVAAKKHSAGNITLTDIGRFPDRYRDELAYEWLRHCRERQLMGAVGHGEHYGHGP